MYGCWQKRITCLDYICTSSNIELIELLSYEEKRKNPQGEIIATTTMYGHKITPETKTYTRNHHDSKATITARPWHDGRVP